MLRVKEPDTAPDKGPEPSSDKTDKGTNAPDKLLGQTRLFKLTAAFDTGSGAEDKTESSRDYGAACGTGSGISEFCPNM